MASRTPGPWETDDHETYWSILSGSVGQHIADVRKFNSPIVPLAEADANARLIAAAPDLLAALKEIRDNCGCCEDVEPCANCNRAAAAIAKAEPTTAGTRS